MESQRLAAAAAAAAAVAAACRTEAVGAGDGTVTFHAPTGSQLPWASTSGRDQSAGESSLDKRWSQAGAPPPLPLGQQPFTACHLATALHVTAQLVPEPRACSHAERVQLTDFLRVLGRACVGVATTTALPPVELAMALGALASLLSDGEDDSFTTAASRPSTWSQSLDASYDYTTDDDAQYAGPRPRWGGFENDYGDADSAGFWGAAFSAGAPSDWSISGDEDGTGTRVVLLRREGPHRTSSGRALHAAWLDERWVDAMLTPSLLSYLQRFKPRQVSSVLWALAKLGVRPRAELLSLLLERAAFFARAALRHSGRFGKADIRNTASEGMTPQGLSLTLWAVGRLGFQPTKASLDTLLGACELDMLDAVKSSRHAAGTGSSVGSGGSSTSAKEHSREAGGCTYRDLAQRVWALATLERHPGLAWTDLAVRAFLAQGEARPDARLIGQSLSMFTWGLARLHALDPGWQPLALPGAPTGSDAKPSLQPEERVISGIGVSGAELQGDDVPAHELLLARRESSKGASGSGRSPDAGAKVASAQMESLDDFLQSLTPGAEPADPGFEAGDVLPLRKPQAVALMALLREGLPYMTSQHLATVLWALSRLDIRPSQAWLQAYLKASARLMSVALKDPYQRRLFGAQALSVMLYAMAKLRYRPPFPWMVRYMEVCRRELPAFGPQQASNIAWALARLSFKPPGYWVRDFVAATQGLLPVMPPLALCTLLWSVARWRRSPPRSWVRTALMVSADHLRSGAQEWQAEAEALEEAASALLTSRAASRMGSRARQTAQAPRASEGAIPSGGRQLTLRPELLACLVWAVPRLTQRQPPLAWMSVATMATQAVIRYKRSSVAIAGAEVRALSTSDGAATGRWEVEQPDSRTLIVLLLGWARLRGQLAEGVLTVALLCIAEDAEFTVASRYQEGDGPGARRPDAEAESGGGFRVDAGQIVLALWSCAVMGSVPQEGVVDRLLSLYLQLVRPDLERRPVSAHAAGGLEGTAREHEMGPHGNGSSRDASADGTLQSTAGVRTATAGASSSAASPASAARGPDSSEVQQHQRSDGLALAQALVRKQAELGMLLFSMLRFEVAMPPDWLSDVLLVVGKELERLAAAVAAAARDGPNLSDEMAAARAVPLAVSTEAVAPKVQADASPPPPQQLSSSASVLTGAELQTPLRLLTVATLVRACLAWGVYPGDRWLEAAGVCVDASVLQTQLKRQYGRANLEDKLRYMLEELRQMKADAEGRGPGEGQLRPAGGVWAAAEAAGGAVLTNAVAAMAAGSAAAWMQGLVW